MIALVFPLGLKAFTDKILLFSGLLAAFGLGHIGFSYFVSFFFSSPQSALKAFTFIYMFGGFMVPFFFKNSIYLIHGC